jgi:SpoVK/Ycf46/Vps4 family AAA+-type ATPase
MPDRSTADRSYVADATNAFIHARNELVESGAKVLFLGATNHPSKVDSAMMSSARLIRLPLPNIEARTDFFNYQLIGSYQENDHSEGYILSEITPKYMAEKTDNYSYRDLRKLLDKIGVTVLKNIKKAHPEYERLKSDEEKDERYLNAFYVNKEGIITKELFNKELLECPPIDITKDIEELHMFELRMGR